MDIVPIPAGRVVVNYRITIFYSNKSHLTNLRIEYKLLIVPNANLPPYNIEDDWTYDTSVYYIGRLAPMANIQILNQDGKLAACYFHRNVRYDVFTPQTLQAMLIWLNSRFQFGLYGWLIVRQSFYST